MVFRGLPGGRRIEHAVGSLPARLGSHPGMRECLVFAMIFKVFCLMLPIPARPWRARSCFLLGFPMVLQRFREGAFGRADLLVSSRPE